MRDHWQARIAVIAVAALATTACAASGTLPSTSRHVSSRELTLEKTGRVVDADTGAGIPGVKVIVNWQTLSSGIPGYSSTGGTWCDLQKIVTTDADGNYTIPDVSKELDLSDRGTRIGKTPYGLASATHDKDYVLAVFKPGYVRVGDMDVLRERRALESKRLVNSMSFQSIPSIHFGSGKVVIESIAMQRANLSPADSWPYDSRILMDVRCSDRMANNIDQPEIWQIAHTINLEIRDVPCGLPPETILDPSTWGAYSWLIHDGTFNVKFLNRIKELNGQAITARFDPSENLASTTAGNLCKAAEEERGR